MEKDRETPQPNVSANGEKEELGYEAPEIIKHEALRDLTAACSGSTEECGEVV